MPFYRLRKSGGLLMQEAVGGGPELVLEVNWNSGLGNGTTALSDGGKLPNFACTPGADVLQVVPGSVIGWTRTPNILYTEDIGEGDCLEMECDQPSWPLQTWYLRAWFHVANLVHAINHPSVVGIQTGPATWLGLQDVDGSGYRPAMQYVGDGHLGGTTYLRQYAGPRLSYDTTYRIEWQFDYLGDHADDPTNLGAFRMHPRLYDDAGNRLDDESDWIALSPEGIPATLAALHATSYEGVIYKDNPTVGMQLLEWRSIGVGYEGVGGDTSHPGNPGVWYYGALAVSLEDWIGDYIPNPEG